ncbi:hypothetical protein [Escherichia albertii]|uniref:hypothetical protein n=1 Tax=Escherichia albertii TaxID=208962 RepID=UPI000CF6C799|nr:hypothetical protein [Escherichia albertii]
METVKLSKEYRFEDFEPVTELNLDLDNLKGSDILEVSDLLQSQGHVTVQTSLDLKWSTKTGHRVRVFPVSIFRFVWG